MFCKTVILQRDEIKLHQEYLELPEKRHHGSNISVCQKYMMTLSNGNIFRVTGHLCGDRSPVNSPHKGHWRGALMFYLNCVWINDFPYPEPVYTGWSSVHWNATGMPLVDAVYTGIPLEKLSWNSPTLKYHWRNLVESVPHWDATGETLTFAAYTGTPLEGLWQPTHAPTHIVKHAE